MRKILAALFTTAALAAPAAATVTASAAPVTHLAMLYDSHPGMLYD